MCRWQGLAMTLDYTLPLSVGLVSLMQSLLALATALFLQRMYFDPSFTITNILGLITVLDQRCKC